jgi:hypothetical protein
MQATGGQQAALMAVRLTVGVLLARFGLLDIMDAGRVGAEEQSFLAVLSSAGVRDYLGWVKLIIGGCIALGFGLRAMGPALLALAMAWSAVLGLDLAVPPSPGHSTVKLAETQALLAWSLTAVGVSLVLLAFRGVDQLSVDGLLKARRDEDEAGRNRATA